MHYDICFLVTDFPFQFLGDSMKPIVTTMQARGRQAVSWLGAIAHRTAYFFQRGVAKDASSQRHPSVILLLARKHWMVAIGLVAAVAAFWTTQRYAENRVLQERDRMLPKGGLVEVLVASRDLSGGDVASPTTISIRRVPKEWMLADSLGPLDFDAVHQRALAHPLAEGHPLTLAHLRQSAAQGSVLRLDPGFRAVSIPVDEVSSVAGLIQPGDRVDLWAAALTLPTPSAGEVAIMALPTAERAPPKGARLLAENLRVIATGVNTERVDGPRTGSSATPSAYSSVTLAVPASVAAVVLGGQFQGRLGIALRAPDEPRAEGRSVKQVAAIPVMAPVEILIGGLEGGQP